MKYEKLVRDRIPEIIRSKGVEPVVHIATEEEYREKLRMKLREEVDEYLESGSPEELADILEVVYALGDAAGVSREDIERLREAKAVERGAFKEHIILDES
ncbi:MAG: nucleoside triphosphate pyrophosphohydrolase [Candidatus Yanofskybacteria bacterium]|nr:nucleoside triphosphate pyrophosphohydrolase [Candidatus Yanofskybacteria bacterium]